MSLRASEETTPLASQPQQQPRLMQPSTGALYSDAIRLRPGATINGARPVAAADLGRRSFQEPFVPRRAPSTHALNGGLNIDALVASAQASLRMREEMDTEGKVMDKIKGIKKWFQKKTKQAKDKVKKMMKKKDDDAEDTPEEDSGSDDECLGGGKPPCTDPKRTSAAFDSIDIVHTAASKKSKKAKKAAKKRANAALRLAEALGVVEEEEPESDDGEFVRRVNGVEQDPNNAVQIPWGKQASSDDMLDDARTVMQQHALEVHGIDLETADAHTRLLHARAAEVLTGMTLRADDGLDTESVMQKAREAKEWLKAKAKAAKEKVKHLLKKKKDDDEEEEEESTEEEEKKKRASARQQLIDAGLVPSGAGYELVEALVDAHEMVTQYALEVDGIDMATADADTRALHTHMAEAIAHLHIASNGAAWEEDLDVGAPEWWDRHAGWAHEVETGAPGWWERKKEQAKAAMAKAKEAVSKASDKAKELASKASAKAKELKEKVENSAVGQMASKAKAAAMKFAKEKYARFTNEDRITKMERYDYELYVSQNPLTDVLIDKKQVTLPVGGDPQAEFYDPHTRAVEGKEPFYGLIATKQKDVLTNDLGDKAFNLAAKDSMKVLSIEKHREVFLATTPDPAVDPLSHVDQTTLGILDAGTFVKRALAQGEAQHHAVPDKNNTSSMVFPSKPNGAHPLCLGHSMMVPVADVAGGGNALGLVRHLVSAEWLKEVEAELVASPLRKGFSDMVSAEGADHKPFIIPVPSKYDEGSEAYKTAFEGSGAKPNESMRPVSALLVVPVTRDTFDPMSGAFLMSGGEGKQEQNHLVEFAYERLYPYQPAPAAAKLQTYSDPSGERRKELNAKLVEKGPFDTYVDLKKAADELGYDATKTEPVTWHVSKYDVIDRYHVAVFALGLSPECDARGNPMACETAMDGAGSGKLLMIGTHPLLMGKRLTGETGQFDMEAPGSIYTSHGGDKPLINALPIALEGKHIDLRFLWAGMKVAQRCFEKATNTRVSKPSLSRFRYLVGLDKELWQNADQKFGTKSLLDNAKDLLKKSDKAGSFQRRSDTAAAFDDARFGQALEDLGLVHVTTGEQLKLHEMTEDELGQALQLAGIDLDSDED